MTNSQIEALVPVWVQRLLNDIRSPRLLSIDCCDSEGIGESCVMPC